MNTFGRFVAVVMLGLGGFFACVTIYFISKNAADAVVIPGVLAVIFGGLGFGIDKAAGPQQKAESSAKKSRNLGVIALLLALLVFFLVNLASGLHLF